MTTTTITGHGVAPIGIKFEDLKAYCWYRPLTETGVGALDDKAALFRDGKGHLIAFRDYDPWIWVDPESYTYEEITEPFTITMHVNGGAE